jgi:NAD(P)H-dependent FMN reductase
LVSRADGLVIITPEYNHSFPGQLKGVLDMLLKEYKNKSVGYVGVSAGSWGGVRAIEQLLPVARHIGLVSISKDLNFPNVKDTFDEEGKILNEDFYGRFDKFIKELLWLTKALKWGRENLG